MFGLGILFAAFLTWGFRTLPEEKWQVMASIPLRKTESGSWEGANITYYGLFVAASTVAAASVMLILMAAIHIPIAVTMLILLLLIMVTFPASKFVAAIVEKKPRHAYYRRSLFPGNSCGSFTDLSTRFSKDGRDRSHSHSSGSLFAGHNLRFRRRPGTPGLHQLRVLLRQASLR